jgi:integrase
LQQGLEKKMQNFKTLNFTFDFRPAQLHNTKNGYHIEYWVTDPTLGELKRVRKKINRIPKNHIAKYSKLVIDKINAQLYAGVNPLVEQESPEFYTRIYEALDHFIRSKSKELRDNSMRSYRSFAKTLKEYCMKRFQENCFVITIDKFEAIKMMEHLYEQKKLSNKSYNNYLTFFRALFNWFKDMGYCNANVFKGIKKKKQQKKQRCLVNPRTRTQIKMYFREHHKHMHVASLLIYHSLIRPNELTHLKPSHFNLANQTIFIPAEGSKNGNDRIATIPDVMMLELIQSRILEINSNMYVFGKGWEANKLRIDPREFTREWRKMRDALGLDEAIKLYSLRDSGIVQMLNDGISPEEVMKQADHHSLEMTTIYAKHANPTGSNQIKKFSSGF